MGNRVTETTYIIKKKVYGWSKYGGSRDNVRKEQLPTWYCQACGMEQVKVLPQYMVPTDKDNMEFARVCTLCKHVYEHGKYVDLDALTEVVRAPKQIIQLANQATLAIRY